MDLDLFRERAARFQALARRDPAAYRRGLVALVALGYGYVLAIVAGLVAINVGLVILAGKGVGVAAILKLLIGAGLLTVVVLRAMWVRLEPVPGVPVTPEEAPALFAMVEEVRAGLRASPVHRIQISDELNASMQQLPTMGIFGMHRNTLTLGLPYLQALSTEHIRTVVAHEIAHLSARHSATGAWVVRVSSMWHSLRMQMEKREGFGSLLVRPFFRRYIPYFDAYTLALSRENEFEADRLAAESVGSDGARHTAEALARGELVARQDGEEFWPAFGKLARTHATPPFGPYAARVQGIGGAHDDARNAERIRAALGRESAAWDTHPTLRERMEALGATEVTAAILAPPATTAADALLGPLAARLAERFDAEWITMTEADWSNAHRDARERRGTLALMDLNAAAGKLRPEDALEYALLVADERGAAEAIPLLAPVAAREPENADARFQLGRLLLAVRDPAGLAHLDAAVELERRCTLVATDLALDFLAVHGSREDSVRVRERADRYEADQLRAYEERSTIPRNVALAPHTVSHADVDRLRRVLQGYPKVKRAYLVRRPTKTLDEFPCHILVLDFGFWSLDENAVPFVDRVAGEIDFVYGDVLVATTTSNGLGKKAKKIPDARIYTKS